MQDTVSSYAVDNANPQFDSFQQELFEHCSNTFEAFRGLGNVAEDMRILSLNAELAAGRAGTYGVSIRALTQYTRELVNRLEQINLEMKKVEAFGSPDQEEEQAASAQVEAAEGAEETEETSGEVVQLKPGTDSDADIAVALKRFAEENGGVKYLNEQAKRIAEVVSQSNSIATNMAIEAATAGQYEDTFTNVANDMRGFVDTLKNMVTRAQDSIEKAFRVEKNLKEIEATGR